MCHDPRAEGPVLSHPLLEDTVLEPSTFTFSDSSSGASSLDVDIIGIRKVIATKIRRAAAQGVDKCRKIRRKLSRESGLVSFHEDA